MIDNGLADILACSTLRTLFQPIVDLESLGLVAYEALTRGPVGSPLEHPDALFAAARSSGLLAELDAACREAAFAAAAAGGLQTPCGLFVNAEPEALDTVGAEVGPKPPAVVLEITEHLHAADPAELLRSIARVRELGWIIALDDVGANKASVAMLPLIDPQVIKLDRRIVQNLPSPHSVAVVSAVTTHSALTGAIIVAEGIETAQQLESAIAAGATLGQGWLFGHPEVLPSPLPPVSGLGRALGLGRGPGLGPGLPPA